MPRSFSDRSRSRSIPKYDHQRRYRRYDSSRRQHSCDRSYDRRRYSREDRSEERHEEDMCRVHIADLPANITQYDIEKVFMKYGDITEVWVAKSPPCFAFCVYNQKKDAAEAVREMNNKFIGEHRCRVTFARPRTRGKKRRWDPSMKCYQCGDRGHFARDCDGGPRSWTTNYESRSRGRGTDHKRRSNSRSRSRSW